MKIIKGYTQWLNEDTTTVTTNPGAKPEGYTHTSSGRVYKYPFKDDNAANAYLERPQVDPAFVQKYLPTLYSQNLNLNYQGEAGATDLITLLKSAISAQLEVCAIRGITTERDTKASTWAGLANIPVQMNQGKTTMMTSAQKNAGEAINKFLTSLKETMDSKKTPAIYDKIVAEWNTNFPTIWKAQLAKAGLPNLATA